MDRKSVTGYSMFKDIRDYFGFKSSLSSEPQVKNNANKTPRHLGIYCNKQKVSNKLRRRKLNHQSPHHESLNLKYNLSELPEVTVISESSCSSDDMLFKSGTERNSGVQLVTSTASKKSKLDLGFTKADTKSKSGPQRFIDKRQPTKSNVVSSTQRWELVVNESSSSSLKKINQNTSSVRKEELPAHKSCLEEIRESNPVFPVKRIFAALQRKYKERNDELNYLEAVRIPASNNPPPSQNPSGRKRKLPPNERAGSEKALKRGRDSSEVVEDKGAMTMVIGSPSEMSRRSSAALPSRGQPGKSRLSRKHRLRQQQRESGDLSPGVGDEQTPDQIHQAESDSKNQSCDGRDKNIEELLWTDKYSPQNSSEVIGNSVAVKKLHSWLKRWKLQADCEERRKELEKRREENSNDSWDCGDFQGEACWEEGGEEELPTTMLITGPPGVGKTASVYACALELGFKVFEVNASSQRNGHHVLTQLKEATQSHQVETQGHALFKPTYLRNYSNSSTKPDTLSVTEASSRKLVSSSRKWPGHKGKGKPKKLASIPLANFFKMKSKAESIIVERPSPTKTNIQTSLNYPLPNNEEPATGEHNRRMATSLILFEEVDIIFDDDVGFLSAIKTFMSTSKRPVILTTNDPSFSETFKANFEEILFKMPLVVNVCTYLQLLCLAENVRTDPGDVTSLLKVNRCDIRRSLLQVQLWVCSSERHWLKMAASQGPEVPLMEPQVQKPAFHLPVCDLGCTQSMFGPLNPGFIQDLVKNRKSWTEAPVTKLMEVLIESWRRGFPLLYSNVELLLPLPAKAQSASVYSSEEVAQSGPQNRPTPPKIHSQPPELSYTSPIRTYSRLSRKKHVQVSDPCSVKSVLPHRTTLSWKNINSRTVHTNDKSKTEDQSRKLESCCLGALAGFMDLMSYLDGTSPTPDFHTSGPCRPGEFIWTGAELKDGLLDEIQEEDHGSCSRGWERSLEIQAAVEALAFQMCHTAVSEVLGRVQELGEDHGQRLKEKLALSVPPYRQGFSFTQNTVCEPSVSQRRKDITKSILSSRAFSTMGNKQAVAVDYMPFLRTICQLEKAQEQVGGRFLHYLLRNHLGISRSTIQLLAEDFPKVPGHLYCKSEPRC